MRKNRMMRVASALLVVVLLTTCAISGTFAKYVTEGSAAASARVAKWGVEFDNTSDMFLDQYAYDDQSKNHYASWKFSVDSDNGDKVVAPGTTGNAYQLTTKGAPEVSYIVEFAVEETTMKTVFLKKGLDGAALANTYYPVVYTLTIGSESVTVADGQASTLAAAIEGVAYFFEVTTGHYYCRVDKDAAWVDCGTTAPVLNLTWNWAFHKDAATDVLDTMLGNLAVNPAWYEPQTIGADDFCLNVALNVTATATQID